MYSQRLSKKAIRVFTFITLVVSITRLAAIITSPIYMMTGSMFTIGRTVTLTFYTKCPGSTFYK